MNPALIITHTEYSLRDLVILMLALLFLFYAGKLVGRIQAKSERKKWLRTLLRQRITPWHVGQMSPVAMRPNEVRSMAETIIDHLLADKDAYLDPVVTVIDLGENATPEQVKAFRDHFASASPAERAEIIKERNRA